MKHGPNPRFVKPGHHPGNAKSDIQQRKDGVDQRFDPSGKGRALHPAADGQIVVQAQSGGVGSAKVDDLDKESLYPASGHVALRAGDGEGIPGGRP